MWPAEPTAVPPADAIAAAPAQKPVETQQPALRAQAVHSSASKPEGQAAGTAMASAEAAGAHSSGDGAWELASMPSTACQIRQGPAAPTAAQATSDATARRGKPMRPPNHQMSAI